MNKIFEEYTETPKTVEEIEQEFKKMMEDPDFAELMNEPLEK